MALATLAAVVLDISPAAAAATTELVSISSGGAQSDDLSTMDVPNGVSTDNGRFVVFDSYATNLVAGDTNGERDIFVRDRQAGTTERVSVSSGGVQGDGSSFLSAISDNGRYVAFGSVAGNLVPGDTNGVQDVFVRDRQAGTTERVSLTAAGAQPNEESAVPAMSDDGNRVAFLSVATDMVPGDTNSFLDVFVRDRQAGTTVRVSVSSAAAQGNGEPSLPHISGAGNHVSFASTADNLVPGDTNGEADLFVHDLQTATTQRVSVATGGGEADSASNSRSSMSDDGRFVGFESQAANLVAADTNGTTDAFVHDRQNATTERVSVSTGGVQGDAETAAPTLSDDGRLVAFPSVATNLVVSDTNGFGDIFVRDRQAATTERVSLSDGGAQGNSYSDLAFVSGDGRHVAFTSDASNLVASDTNGTGDVFVRDLDAGEGCTITGTGGDDSLTGTAGADVICGLGGNDTIDGGGGDDTVKGGPGSDTLSGGGGADAVDGGGGADRVDGGGGDDVIAGGGGDDIIDGGGGHDSVGGGDGADRVDGGGGHDTLGGGSGNDSLDGQGGHDTVTDHDGADTAFGDTGNDHLDVRDGVGGDTANGGSGTDNCATDSGDIVSSC
ncbi:hypothetical protein [Actinoplanes sp. DH11]|uniref:TolB family protein n=1 Tax=Actinoplanes sp. DH11 TaxID=2857011 RepID=UPI0021027CBB|nr:hypothetical protein [Actinoplanes sp. DH11]